MTPFDLQPRDLWSASALWRSLPSLFLILFSAHPRSFYQPPFFSFLPQNIAVDYLHIVRVAMVYGCVRLEGRVPVTNVRLIFDVYAFKVFELKVMNVVGML